MMKIQGISRQEESELPTFNNHEEASKYFEERYGEKFVFEESLNSGDGICFFYRLITDEEAYIKGTVDLNSTGYVGIEFKNSYQPIRIMEDGSIRIVY
ncbi:hypothetical protein [Planococcus sp. YIM B11945]|uniref:hypothetical protein n=1 Tax=Planococcus sp. YIM B11945 TaxID=3435410 RepID=UPI003D7E859F